jgi:hypothetical protein
MSKLVRIRKATPQKAFIVRLEFTDGIQRDVDLEPYLHGPIFASIREDHQIFRSVHVGPSGTIVWDNGADIDPDVLYHGLKPAWMETEQPTAN